MYTVCSSTRRLTRVNSRSGLLLIMIRGILQSARYETYAGSATLPDSDDYVDCADGYKSYTWRILEQGTSKGEYVYVVIVDFRLGVRLRFAQGPCTMILVYAGRFRMKNSKLP
jgi:hypothetical protein